MQATLDQSLEDATAETRRGAATEGYTLAEGESYDAMLVFKKGTIATGGSFAFTDWGRGRRSARRLLEALGAREG